MTRAKDAARLVKDHLDHHDFFSNFDLHIGHLRPIRCSGGGPRRGRLNIETWAIHPDVFGNSISSLTFSRAIAGDGTALIIVRLRPGQTISR